MLMSIFPRYALPEASNFAAPFEGLYDFIFWISTISFLGIFIALVFFTHRYARKKRGETTPYIEGHTPTEATVAVGLFILVMAIFYWGYVDYMKMRTMPADALQINVTARQWAWEFQYANGRKLTNEFTVPLGKKVKLLMTSNDVLHSFFVPNFRVKQDVVPGTYTAVWFEPTQTGDHHVFCAEYCGTAHSQMLAKLTVVAPEQYDQWQLDWELEGLRAAAAGKTDDSARPEPVEGRPATGDAIPLVEQGKQIYTDKGCPACHSVDGRKLIGPTHQKVFGAIEEMTDGTKVTVDENYLRESIVEPQAKVVKGFDPVMPTYKGQLKDEEITAVIEYLKSLK